MTYKRWLVISLLLTVVFSGCGPSTSDTATVTPIITAPPTSSASNLRLSGSSVVASGVIVPARFARMGSASPVMIEAIEVEVGETVEAGDELLRFQGQAAREAAVASYELAVLDAQRALDDLYQNSDVITAQAQLALANAREQLEAAEYKWTVQQEGNRASENTILAAEANLILANEEVDRAQSIYDHASGEASSALALSNLIAAKQHRDSIQRNLNWYLGAPDEIDQAILDAELAQAKANLAAAEREYEKVQDGPDSDLLAGAIASVKLAEAQLKSAQEAVQNGVISAPFDGIVAELTITQGEVIVPGQVLVVVADLTNLRVETTDLSERDINQVSVGSKAEIFIEPLGITIPAYVAAISPSASVIGGDVVYKVTLDLDEQPEGLFWGMSTEVEIEVQ